MITITKKIFKCFICFCALIFLFQIVYITATYIKSRYKEAYTAITTTDCSIKSPLNANLLNSDNHQPVQITYFPKNNSEFLAGINNAALVYEYINEKGNLVYKAIFSGNIPNKIDSVTKITDFPLNNLPKFTFSPFINRAYSDKKNASYIYVTMSYNIFSNFIYDNGYYIHYKDSVTDIDSLSAEPVSASNVVIQFTADSHGIKKTTAIEHGKGLLFCGGKVVDIEWSNDGESPIKVVDKNGDPVSLIEGKTWWIIIDENCPVAFN